MAAVWRDTSTLAGGSSAPAAAVVEQSGALWRATVTRVAAGRPYVIAERLYPGQELGPCPILEGLGAVTAGQAVWVAPIGGGGRGVVIVARDGGLGVGGPAVTTKGDLLAATGAGALARLAAGAAGSILTPNPAVTVGLEWLAAGGKGALLAPNPAVADGLEWLLAGAAGATLTPNPSMPAGLEWTNAHPRGILGFAFDVTGQGSITTDVDLTGLTKTLTVTNRRLLIIGYVDLRSSVVGDACRVKIKEGSTTVGSAQITQVAAGFGNRHVAMALRAPSGAVTYKLTAERSAGTGTLSTAATGSEPNMLIIIDLGEAAQVIDFAGRGIASAEALGSHTVH